jgi:hypothetical protein
MSSPPHDTPLEARRLAGKSLRAATPRLALGELGERPASYDPIGRVISQGQDRVTELLPLRYKRMLENPLSFFRGAALLMAEDLARSPSSTLEVQICGDAHLSNFGIFSSPERQMVFDVTDFDETDVGPFDWDVRRLASSLVVASAQLGHEPRQQETIALAAAYEYRRAMGVFARQTRLEVWYATLDLNAVFVDLKGFFSDSARRKIDGVMSHAEQRDATTAFTKVVAYGAKGPVIVEDPPHFSRLGAEGDQFRDADVLDIVSGYRGTLSSDRQVLLSQFNVRDVARHVVGVGSVGTECFAVLLVGRDDHDPFFLQIKEAQVSVVSSARQGVSTLTPGERVVRGQKMMQATSDAFLGWHSLHVAGRDRGFYVRQLYDNKASIDVVRLDEALLVVYGRLCAWTLARAHARSGLGAEIAGYLGKAARFDEAMAAFALAYRARNQRDFEAMTNAAKQGRITVAP